MANENMQTWEYCFVHTDGGRAFHVNDQKLPKPYPNMFEYANDIGGKGWELVAINENSVYIFKRPR